MPDRLDRYRAKRSPESTLEPFGTAEGARARPRLFVVQKHGARRLHWDFRLELGGTLRSWAVPRGPSPDPAEKRLAVEVEDHPVEYADFEGIIPQGNYGAGAVIVWDRGSWMPAEDPEAGLQKGKLLFDLLGYKLRGRWALVRTKGSHTRSQGRTPAKEWLLIKHHDSWARAGAEASYPQESVLSGLTMEELREGKSREGELLAKLAGLRAQRRKVDPRKLEIMLAEQRERPFSGPGWLFELKYDGFRVIAAREEGKPLLRYRHGIDATASYPEVARALAALPYTSIIMDGEIVVLDGEGKPAFQGLQKRAQAQRAADIARGAVDAPATLYLFDLLGFGGYDLRPLPLRTRKELLSELLPRVGPLRFADHVEERGQELYAEVRARGLEGMVAKKVDAPYRGGRRPDWLKIRVQRTGDFVVVGFTEPTGTRVGLGALHLAFCEAGELRYAGRAGTGLSTQLLADLRAQLDRMRRKTPPCSGPAPTGPGHVWVEPRLIAEVRYLHWTEEGLLRQPAFLRLRDDKKIEECTRPIEPQDEPAAPPPRPAELAVEKKIPFTNLKKVFWPEEGYTKGDLIEFYRVISPWLLPYLRDRPLVMTRYPDGITGKSFFQKDAPGFAPGWVRTERIWSEHAAREIDYFVCDDLESLLYVINLGTIPLHVWSSRVAALQAPDWCILDLDPKEAPFAHVVKVARAARALCEHIELESFMKTSGQKGLHVLIPLGGQCTYEQSRTLGQLLARVLEQELPDIATTVRHIPSRGGRVYLDYLQNRHGQTLVAPFSVRPQPGAPVSTPLRWSEVGSRLDPRKLTILTVPKRMERLGEDPFAGVLRGQPDLAAVLDRLGRRVTPQKAK